jgi:yeast amino acid transporter
VDGLPFKSWGYPYNAYFDVASNIFLALIQGWTTFSPFDAGNFVDAYILFPLFPVIYFGYKFGFKTRYWRLAEVDLDHRQRKDLDAKEEDLDKHGVIRPKQTLWQRLLRNFQSCC